MGFCFLVAYQFIAMVLGWPLIVYNNKDGVLVEWSPIPVLVGIISTVISIWWFYDKDGS